MGDSKPSGTVTFLFTDIEGSTRLWEEHPKAMKAALAEHDRIVRSALESAGGYVFSTAGDAFSVVFSRPERAIAAAVKAQLSLAGLGQGTPPLRVRMAIHTGTADERDGDYFGPALNRTARLLSVGHGGQVLVSLATEELVQDALEGGVALRDLGEHRLKDLSRPVRVFQVDVSGLPSDFPPPRSLDVFPHNLPVQLTSFVGRENEIEEVAKLVRSARMVTLAGVGGAGKTRLAMQTAAEMLPEFDDGCWLVELAPLTNPERIPTTTATVLGIQEKPDEDLLDTLMAWLRDKEVLLILDNCEHLIDAAARFAERVLATAPGVTLLATSREMVGVPGEYPYQVRSLAAPDRIDHQTHSELLGYPAVRLFAERAELARPGFRITDVNAPAVVQIVNRLDGMPLAIELAVARLRMMPAEQIAERLDDRFRLLTGGSRTALPRQQTLEAAIDWSYDLLSDEEKTLFSRLAVFMGGFTLEAAEKVCSLEPLEEPAILDLLGRLVDKSLVQAEDREEGVRYQMLETLRQYARARLAESEEVTAIRRRHAEYFRALAESAEPYLRGTEEDYWFRRLDEELDNLRQAMGWAVEAGEGELAQATAGALYRYFMYRFRSAEGREWAETAAETSDQPSVARVKALLAAGTLAQISLDHRVSLKYLDQAIAMARSLSADHLLAAALHNRANLSSAVGMWEEAEPLWTESLELHRRLGSRDGEIIDLETLTSAALARDDHESAIARAREAIALARELGSERLLYHATESLLITLREAGRLDESVGVLQELAHQDERLGVELYPGRTAFAAAVLAMDRGDLDGAGPLLLDSARRFTTLPDYQMIAGAVQWFLCHSARLFLEVGEPGTAARLLGASDAVLSPTGHHRAPYEQREADAIRRALEEQDRDFSTNYASGQALEPAQAMGFLLQALEGLISPGDA